MPAGKGTYGSKVGRPKSKKKKTDNKKKSALKNKLKSEKSLEPPKPTTCEAISCSINVNYF